jgi:hypothetical protein
LEEVPVSKINNIQLVSEGAHWEVVCQQCRTTIGRVGQGKLLINPSTTTKKEVRYVSEPLPKKCKETATKSL